MYQQGRISADREPAPYILPHGSVILSPRIVFVLSSQPSQPDMRSCTVRKHRMRIEGRHKLNGIISLQPIHGFAKPTHEVLCVILSTTNEYGILIGCPHD